jgi:hypothetical protein
MSNMRLKFADRLVAVAASAVLLTALAAFSETQGVQETVCLESSRARVLTEAQFRALLDTVAEGWNTGRADLAASCFAETAVYLEPPDRLDPQLARIPVRLDAILGRLRGLEPLGPILSQRSWASVMAPITLPTLSRSPSVRRSQHARLSARGSASAVAMTEVRRHSDPSRGAAQDVAICWRSRVVLLLRT